MANGQPDIWDDDLWDEVNHDATEYVRRLRMQGRVTPRIPNVRKRVPDVLPFDKKIIG